MTQNNTLFRNAALEVISSPERLDQQAKVVRPSTWILLFALVCATLAAILWAFFGNISDGLKVNGIIFPHSGVSGIYTYSSGLVTDSLVKEGDYVEADQIIIIMPNEGLLKDIKSLREEIAGMENSLVKKSGVRNGVTETELLSEQKNIELLIIKKKASLEELVDEYERTSIIKSPVSGTVQSIISTNNIINAGQRVANIINEDKLTNSKEVIAFVPLVIAKKIKIGMEAQVSPVFAPREEYGYMKGHVSKVASIPVTNDILQKTFGDIQYAKSILTDENSVEVRIMLNIDPQSKNSFQWSNKKGQDLAVETSTICNVQIITETRHPIDLLFSFGR
jgi:biotin carboxyl carrier protein